MELKEKTRLCHACAGLKFREAVEQVLIKKKETENKVRANKEKADEEEKEDEGNDENTWSVGSDDGDEDAVQLGDPWHLNLADVSTSSSTCALCALLMKGWAHHRKLVVRNSIENAEFNLEDPPPDLHLPIEQIQAYQDAPVTLEFVTRERQIDGGQMGRASIFLRAHCLVENSTSFDVHGALLAEMRLVRESSDGRGIDRDGVTSPAPIDASNIFEGSEVLPEEIFNNIDPWIPTNPLSEKSIGTAKNWLDTCVQTHGPACGRDVNGDAGWMPTRVLEVIPGDIKIYLRNSRDLSAGEGARFVALSHCWEQGGTPFTTTHATLPARMEGITIEELPKTFRDSVVLVSSLGLRFIWIDSLCIIQDDAGDWAKEAAQMASIYRNAHLVVNAANSDADTEGFLKPRHRPDFVRTTYLFGLQLLPTKEERWPDAVGLDSLLGEPVSARAWCLQERYLPRRALEYGANGMFWECESMRASEAGDAVAQEGGYLRRLCKTASIGASVFAQSQHDTYDWTRLDDVNWIAWYKMIEEYTSRSITKSTDRLPALSGLVQVIIRETASDLEYFAGIWKTGLLEGLAWCKSKHLDPLPPTNEYVAPSWSWASVTGTVQFPVYSFGEKRARAKSYIRFEPLAEYVSHTTVTRNADPYGRLLEGSLTLRSSLVPVTKVRRREQHEVPSFDDVYGLPPASSEVGDSVLQFEVGNRKKVWIEGGLDDSIAQMQETEEMFILFLTRLPYFLDFVFLEHRFGLLVKLTDGGMFTRVGFVDGVILKETGIIWKKLEVVRYAHPFKDGDVVDNSGAGDPLGLEKQDVKVC